MILTFDGKDVVKIAFSLPWSTAHSNYYTVENLAKDLIDVESDWTAGGETHAAHKQPINATVKIRNHKE